jgi:hypothetical protein
LSFLSRRCPTPRLVTTKVAVDEAFFFVLRTPLS